MNNTSGATKIKVHFQDGRSEKLAFEFAVGNRLPLNNETIGHHSGCTLFATVRGIKLVADIGTPPFEFRGEVGTEFYVQQGDIWKAERVNIEFVQVPDLAEEARTKFIDLKNLTPQGNKLSETVTNLKAQKGLLSEPVYDVPTISKLELGRASELTSKLPFRSPSSFGEPAASPILLKTQSAPSVALKGSAPPNAIEEIPEPKVDTHLKEEVFHALVSVFILVILAQVAAKVIFWGTNEEWYFPFRHFAGVGMLMGVGLFFFAKGSLKHGKGFQDWLTGHWDKGSVEVLRRVAWVCGAVLTGAAMLTVMGFWIGQGWSKFETRTTPVDTSVVFQPSPAEIKEVKPAEPVTNGLIQPITPALLDLSKELNKLHPSLEKRQRR